MTLHAVEDPAAFVPASRHMELAVLAACLVSKTARNEARKAITGEDFYYGQHAAVWDAMNRLDRHGKTVDAMTVGELLKPGTLAHSLLPDLVTTVANPDGIPDYAAVVRGWAVKRRLQDEATRVAQQALNPDANANGLAAAVANRFAAIRDAGVAAEDIHALMLDELLDLPDEDYDWIIPGLLERGDRLMLTGEEGLGKSSLLRQIAILAAAGIHPFLTTRRITPIKALVYDCENSRRQFVRKARDLHTFACLNGDNPGPRVMVENVGRIDITRDRDLAKIHALCDAMQPDVLVIGPLYRLIPRAVNTDDEATPLLAALDTIKDRGIALLIEAHAGKSVIENGGGRNMAPRGSSALLGWPEFGYGMRKLDGLSDYCDLLPWRGARDERAWPSRMRRADHMTWEEVP
ncbi:MAG TPA: AAA family ATPase [Acidimicrobiales bacterium]|nr:AAA family ATPase [Acidimicrobiales bacterium]